MTIQYDAELTDSGPQRALYLYEQEKLKQAEIAKQLDVSQSTVSTWIQKEKAKQEGTRTRDIHYRTIFRDLAWIAFVLCWVIITIDITHITWR